MSSQVALTPAQTQKGVQLAKKVVEGGTRKSYGALRKWVARHSPRGNVSKVTSRLMKLARRGYKKRSRSPRRK